MTPQSPQAMKSDKELLRIWNKRNYKTKYYWMYHELSPEEKSRLFDLLK